MDWNDFYNKRINSTYQVYFEEKYKPFLLAIAKCHPTIIKEGGCGIGSISKYFSRYGVICEGFDNDPNMVKLASLNCLKGSFTQGDLFHPSNTGPEFLVTHGVLEHFSDEQIKWILEKYPNSIHYVPLDKYKTPSFGDERLLSKEYWVDNFNIKDYAVFNNGHDLYFSSNV
jgi:hypothetical protein